VKIKLDENLPARLARALEKLGHDTDTIPEERLAGRSDLQVWAAAQEAERFLITQDLDFSDTRRFTPGTHHGILLVRLRDPGRNALLKRVHGLFQTEDVENWKRGFVVVTDRKLRVRYPNTNG
jgi:predicted nuclease of predicted toxin-antitoxin system